MSMPIFVDSAEVQLGGQTILKSISLNVPAGDSLALVGPSGCGKTTLLRSLMGLVPLAQGEIRLGEGADALKSTDIKGATMRRIGYVIQSGGLFPHLTAARNMELPGAMEAWTPQARQQRREQLMEPLGLQGLDLVTRYPAEFSGGQQQRISIGRALFLNPPLLLMDEPFAALDAITRRSLQRDLVRWRKASNQTLVFVTHDLVEAKRLCRQVAILNEGRLEQMGVFSEVASQPKSEFVAAFFAEAFADEA